jgi:uncharacterized protein (TIGR03083 family)
MTAAGALGSLWPMWAELGASLTEEQWAAPTRLPPWDVRALYAHTSAWPRWLAYIVTQERPSPPTHPSAAALLREFNAPGGVAHRARQATAERAVDDGAKSTPEQMIAAWTEVGPPALQAARALGDAVVDYLGLARLRIDDVLAIGVVEATVHLFDLQRALGVRPSAPPEALGLTTSVLTAMADPVGFIEAATGRTGFEAVLT